MREMEGDGARLKLRHREYRGGPQMPIRAWTAAWQLGVPDSICPMSVYGPQMWCGAFRPAHRAHRLLLRGLVDPTTSALGPGSRGPASASSRVGDPLGKLPAQRLRSAASPAPSEVSRARFTHSPVWSVASAVWITFISGTGQGGEEMT